MPTDSQGSKNRVSSIKKSTKNIIKWQAEKDKLKTIASPKGLRLQAKIEKEQKSIERSQVELQKQRVRDAKKTTVGKKLTDVQKTTASVRNYLDNNKLTPVDRRRLEAMGIDFTQKMKEDLNVRKIADDLNYDVNRIFKTGNIDINSYKAILEDYSDLMSAMTSKVDIFKAKQLDIQPPVIEKGVKDYMEKGKVPSFKLEDAKLSIQTSGLTDVQKERVVSDIEKAIGIRDKALSPFSQKKPKKTIIIEPSESESSEEEEFVPEKVIQKPKRKYQKKKVSLKVEDSDSEDD